MGLTNIYVDNQYSAIQTAAVSFLGPIFVPFCNVEKCYKYSHA